MPENLIPMIALGLLIAYWILFFVKLLANRFAPVEKAPAEVVHKQTVDHFSKTSATGKRSRYVVVFSVKGKKKSFYVSEFSYGYYRLHEKGTLEYRGDRLLGFHK